MRATGRSAGAALRMRSPRDGVLAHEFPFGGVELARLVQDRITDGDLADVVELRGACQLVELFGVHSESSPDRDSKAGNAGGVVVEIRLLGVHDPPI